MDVRAITVGLTQEDIKDFLISKKLSHFYHVIKTEFEKSDIFVRTTRINLTPVNDPIFPLDKHKIIGIVEKVTSICETGGIRWFNVPFDLVNIDKTYLEDILEIAFHIISRYPSSFINFVVADKTRINYKAILKISKFIKDTSELGSHGYNNFRVGASCNPKPDTPFFPFTYSSENIGFSLALELPKYFYNIILKHRTRDICELRELIIDKVVPQLRFLDKISYEVGLKTGVHYKGIDTSLAPFKEPESSVAKLIELLGADVFGGNGTLFFTSYLTDILRKIRELSEIKEVGFGGVMYSLLEDPIMGKSNNLKTFSIDSLISYSCVCGCGLDMVPIPGDVFDEEIASIILDIAALSIVLNKPLGVRVLPIPMKKENELTDFDMDFICNTRIQKMKYCVSWQDIFKNNHFSYKNIIN